MNLNWGYFPGSLFFCFAFRHRRQRHPQAVPTLKITTQSHDNLRKAIYFLKIELNFDYSYVEDEQMG